MIPQHTPTPWTKDMTDHLRDDWGNCIVTVHKMADGTRNAKLEMESKGNADFIVCAVNSHQELLARVRLDGNAYHHTHAESVHFRECQNFECLNYKAIIAKAEGRE